MIANNIQYAPKIIGELKLIPQYSVPNKKMYVTIDNSSSSTSLRYPIWFSEKEIKEIIEFLEKILEEKQGIK